MRKPLFVSLVLAGALAAVAGCDAAMDNSNANSFSDRQNQALADPMHYKPPQHYGISDNKGLSDDWRHVANP